jgi:hypothetical protein
VKKNYITHCDSSECKTRIKRCPEYSYFPNTLFFPEYLTGLHNEMLHNLHAPPNIIMVIKTRRMRLVGQGAHIGDMENVYKILVRKPEEKTPHGRPRHILQDNTRMYLREIGGKVWSRFIWLRLGTSCGLL